MTQTSQSRLDEFTDAYVECALWSSTDGSDEGTPLDQDHDRDDLAPETLKQMRDDCTAFYLKHEDVICNPDNHKYLQAGCSTVSIAGHDFWLTRCGHGAGFWDGDWAEPHATALDESSQSFGNIDLCVGDDGLIYGA